MEPRLYRHWVEGRDLVPFTVTVKETDLYIRAATDLKRPALRLVRKYRRQLEQYIARAPAFLTSLEPLPVAAGAPRIAREMMEAALRAGVGPMAAVAGAVAESVGRELAGLSPEVIVENGGDIYLRSRTSRTVGIYAGASPLTGQLGLVVSPADTPLGICTSSGTVGHSLSYGKADAVVVLAPSAALADAAATAIGNRVKTPADIDGAIAFGQGIGGLKGIVIIEGESLGIWGEVKLCETSA